MIARAAGANALALVGAAKDAPRARVEYLRL